MASLFPALPKAAPLALSAEIQEESSLTIQCQSKDEFTILEIWYNYGNMVDKIVGQEICIIGLLNQDVDRVQDLTPGTTKFVE